MNEESPRSDYTTAETSLKRNRWRYVVFGLTIVGGACLLGLSSWPGLLEIAMFDIPFAVVSLPLLGFWFVLLFGLGLRDIVTKPERDRGHRWGLISAAIMFIVIGLLCCHVPQQQSNCL